MKNLFKKSKKGFTIVELVIVVAVIGILSAILIPTFTNLTSTANANALQSNLTNAYNQYVVEFADKEGTLVAQNKIKLSTQGAAADAKGDYYEFDGSKWQHKTSYEGTFEAVDGDATAEGYNPTLGGYFLYK